MIIIKTKSTKDHLCKYCSNDFATCPKANHIVFGDGLGNDNVIECSEFSPISYFNNYPIEGTGRFAKRVDLEEIQGGDKKMSLNHVNRSNDEEIIDIMRSILSDGNMVVETINEAILVKLMKLRGTPIKYNYSFRDIDKDYEQWLEQKNETNNEQQESK